MNGNDRFLNVNDAHLRVTGGNVHASSFNLDQISITTTSTTASTIDFLNETKAFNARSNIEVGTANLFVDTTTSNVGIRTSSPEYALDVHGTANVGALTATILSGIGTSLTALNADNITSGTLDRNTTGSAATLTTPRSIGGVNFDGSADIVPTTFGAATFDTDTLVVDSVNDRVGVGVATPLRTLEVQGNGQTVNGGVIHARISDPGSAPYESNAFSMNMGGYKHSIRMELNTLSLNAFGDVGRYGGMKFVVGDNAASGSGQVDAMTIQPGGNVGIGTISPDKLLEISGASGLDNSTPVHFRITNTQGATNSNPFTDITKPSGLISFYTPDTSTAGPGDVAGIGFRPESTLGGDTALCFYTNSENDDAGTPLQERMCITHDGNVGVGTPSPATKLHVEHYGSAIGDFEGIRIANHATNLHSTSRPAYEFVVSDIAAGTGIGASKFAIGYRGTTSASRTDRLVIDASGNVGIGEVSPEVNLHVKDATSTARILVERVSDSGESNLTLRGLHSSGNTEWQIYHAGSNARLYFWRGSNRGYINFSAANNSLNFTGQHRTFIKDTPFTQAETLEGLIVSSNQNKYIRMSGGIEAGSNAVTINEALPVVTVSSTPRDKKCFGVISLSEDPETREEKHGNFTSIMEKEDGDTRIYINSVGEGGIWVSNTNGTLEAGDYITTSALPGYGMKQDDDLLHNYTVAKITMDCDFNPPIVPIQKIKKIQGIKRYWRSSSGEETTEEKEGFDELIEREELVNDLDEHGQIQWEDHPTETEKAYKIRYLDTDGNITDETNAVHKAAFVGCTYHCG